MIQIIDKQDFGVHTSPIFNKHKILKLENIYLFNLAKFIHKYKHNLLPDCSECPHLTVDQVHNYEIEDNHRDNNLISGIIDLENISPTPPMQLFDDDDDFVNHKSPADSSVV